MKVTILPLNYSSAMSVNIKKHNMMHECLLKVEIENVVEIIQRAPQDKKCLEHYTNFVDALLSPMTEDSTLLKWLQQLKDSIFVLDKDNEELVGAVLKINWNARDKSVIDAYQELVLNLLSAHTYYLRPVLQMILSIFLKGKDDASYSTNASFCFSSSKKVNSGQKEFQAAHKLLKNILCIVPISSSILIPLLAECFPYMKKSAEEHLHYICNLLHMTSYMPLQRNSILEILLDRIIHIDVHCPKNEIEAAEAEADDTEKNGMFLMECDTESEPNSQKKMRDNTSSDTLHHQMANTLDLIMMELFEFMDHVCKKSDSSDLNWEASKKLYKEFLKIFDKLILPTHGCSHVQFIMFYICSLKPPLCEGFLDYLWKKIESFNTAPVIRQVSAFYVGSFLARAKYIPVNTVIATLDVMCNWAHSYIDSQAEHCLSWTDTSVHGTFYSVCQTLFYVFAFRHKELVEMDNGLKYLKGLNFGRIVTCRLNPLKACSTPVVRNFANVARNYQLAYCYTIIEHNNRSLLPVVAQSSSGTTKPVQLIALDTFFPFDPYILKRSGKKISHLYRVYEDYTMEEQYRDNEDSFLHENAAAPINAGLEEFLSYGASPGFKQFSLSPKYR